MRKSVLVLSIVLILLSVFSSVCFASNGKSADSPGHNKESEKDYNTGLPDDSAINKGDRSSDKVNHDDPHSKGIQRPIAPSESAAEHANCDNNGFDCTPGNPEDPPKTEKPPKEKPPKVQKPPVNVEKPPRETRRVCWHSPGASVEVWDNLANFLDETAIIGEGINRFCWDATLDTTYFILAWTSTSGHSGPQYSLTVTGNGPTVHIYNPFVGTLEGDGWKAERLNEPTMAKRAR